MTPNFLIVLSETLDQQDGRRRRVGQASHESYAQTVRDLCPGCGITFASSIDGSDIPPSSNDFHAAFFAGSPIQMFEDTSETRSAARFMQRLLSSGLPAFGSCAGLQIGAVAAGGRCVARGGPLEAGFARHIVATEAGRDHPLLAGRPSSFDAPALHSGIVEDVPAAMTVLASNRSTPVQAAEIRLGEGVFWGVQYHPELALDEIAASLQRQAEDLLEEGLAADRDALEEHLSLLRALAAAPKRTDLAWRLGLDDQITEESHRTRELRNFIGFALARI